MGLWDAFARFVADKDEQSKFSRSLMDTVNRGVVGGLLGAPVDLATMVMRPFGYSDEKPVMGSEWIGDKMQQAGIVSPNRNTLAEMAANFVDPATLQTAAVKLAGALKGAALLPVGITAWHGSPHKFDKFDLSKIGTGEGAQAYGHGLYLAEHPDVAMTYQPRDPKLEQNIMAKYSQAEKKGDYAAMQVYEDYLLHKTPAEIEAAIPEYGYTGKELESVKKAHEYAKKEYFNQKQGALYKTDIPDEAVARFLDWDKKLSEQPEILQMLQPKNASTPFTGDASITGQQLLNQAKSYNPSYGGAEKWLDRLGIKGIRYLDGGSRSAGQGSSNFVVFDPEMIRIIERNQQLTGAKPWQPGEWQGK